MINTLLQGPHVVNVGLDRFSHDLHALGVPVVHVDWSPPARGNAALLRQLDTLEVSRHEVIDPANDRAVARLLEGEPWLVDVQPARDVVPGLDNRTIAHAGPPIQWDRMCGPMRGAIAGAIVFERWAPDLESAAKLAAAGGVQFSPNHHHDAVGPMTGLTTPSQPVMVVENRKFANRAYCTVNEGLGKVMRFGGNDEEVRNRLAWMRDELGPALGAALREGGAVALKPVIARGLAMGDEMHQRNVACTGVMLRELAPRLARTCADGGMLARILEFIAGNDQFFLNVAMATGKALTDPMRGIPGSTVVTAMSRNGTDFGIRVSGTGDTWFTAPVEMPVGLYFPGFSEADSNPDMGDSTIVETIGLGGFAMGAAPAVTGFVGAGSASEAGQFTHAMRALTVTENPAWTIPAMDFAGVPTGIDVCKVVESGRTPTINTGIAHRKPGIGQVGAGIVQAPFACFSAALDALVDSMERGSDSEGNAGS